MQRLILTALLWFSITGLMANNIEVNNISLTGQNTTSDFTLVQFYLSWENSWRISVGPANWDAAWVFVKYRGQRQPLAARHPQHRGLRSARGRGHRRRQ